MGEAVDTEYHANDEASAGEDAPQPSGAPAQCEAGIAAPSPAAPVAPESIKPPERWAYYVAMGRLRRRSVFLAAEDMGRHFGRQVIVDAEYGLDIGLLRERCKEIPNETAGVVVRPADCGDLEHAAKNVDADVECAKIFEDAVRDEGLDMKLAGIDHSFEQARITFYYQASGRVDFRQLVKLLASKLRRRIELYQLNFYSTHISARAAWICAAKQSQSFSRRKSRRAWRSCKSYHTAQGRCRACAESRTAA